MTADSRQSAVGNLLTETVATVGTRNNNRHSYSGLGQPKFRLLRK